MARVFLGGTLKRLALALVVSSGLFALPNARGQADPNDRPPGDRPPAADRADSPPRPDPQRRNDADGPPGLRRAIEELSLPDEQHHKIDAIVEAYRQKERQARADFLEQMKTALTAEQYEKLEAGLNRPPPRGGPERGSGRDPRDSADAGPPGQRPPGNAAGPGNGTGSGEPRPSATPAAVPNPATQPAVTLPDGSLRVPVTFSGGYETDPRDHGRPVVLIAAALNVSSDIFRSAFSHVTPASGGREPEPAQVNRNKQALMHDLAPHGITNDRLDEVSNYYRYSGSRGEMWRNHPAAAYAIVRNGVVTAITVTDAGAGYSSPPQVVVQGVNGLAATVTLAFGTDLAKNGSIQEIKLDAPATRPAAGKGSGGDERR